ncbi:MAG: hypothetical protein V4794_20180 [Pseudomonadota bacterium]
MEFTTNTTSSATGGAEGASSVPFTWQNPVFPAPSPRARRANSDRLTGVLYSHAPRWTQGKHERILAQIKATRTDLDPSFPRPAAEPQATAPAGAAYQLSEVISNFAQGTKSYFDSLTAYALEQMYGPDIPAAAPSGVSKAADTQKANFIKTLRQNGVTRDQAANIVIAWAANGIPLHPSTVPSIYNPAFEFLPGDKLKSTSGASLVYYKSGKGEELVLKCYPPASQQKLSLLNEMTGIDAQNPKFEARCLLASHIAHNILGWDILPKASLGYVGGRVCVVTPRVKGAELLNSINNNLDFAQVFLSAMRGGIVHVDEWGDEFAREFKENYIRLLVFTVLVGDYDRHFQQFIIDAKGLKPDFIQSIDWDISFGSKKTDDVLYIDQKTRQPGSLWPSYIPRAVCNEFGKVNEENLQEAAAIFELTEEEVAALMSRFAVIKKKLATIKKT